MVHDARGDGSDGDDDVPSMDYVRGICLKWLMVDEEMRLSEETQTVYVGQVSPQRRTLSSH